MFDRVHVTSCIKEKIGLEEETEPLRKSLCFACPFILFVWVFYFNYVYKIWQETKKGTPCCTFILIRNRDSIDCKALSLNVTTVAKTLVWIPSTTKGLLSARSHFENRNKNNAWKIISTLFSYPWKKVGLVWNRFPKHYFNCSVRTRCSLPLLHLEIRLSGYADMDGWPLEDELMKDLESPRSLHPSLMSFLLSLLSFLGQGLTPVFMLRNHSCSLLVLVFRST